MQAQNDDDNLNISPGTITRFLGLLSTAVDAATSLVGIPFHYRVFVVAWNIFCRGKKAVQKMVFSSLLGDGHFEKTRKALMVALSTYVKQKREGQAVALGHAIRYKLLLGRTKMHLLGKLLHPPHSVGEGTSALGLGEWDLSIGKIILSPQWYENDVRDRFVNSQWRLLPSPSIWSAALSMEHG